MARLIKQSLAGILSKEELDEVYSAFDIVGDIVIIKIPDSMLERKQVIANAILNNVKHVKTVLMQSSAVQGDYRVRDVQYLAGEKKTNTEYKEHNCRFKVDVSKVYFSPRLSTERARIAKQVTDGETVINMFAGICTFSIVIAKKRETRIYSIDINPDAYTLCVENVKLNKLTDRVVPLLGDAKELIETSKELRGMGDRVLMPLPERARDYLESAIIAAKDGGIIHYFTHVHADSRNESLEVASKELADSMSVGYQLLNRRVVRDVGPHFYQTVMDVRVRKS